MHLIVIDIYMNPSKTQKARGYIGFRNGKSEVSIINALNREEHAPRRKMLSRAFSTAALKKYEPVIFKTAKVFGDTLLANPGSGKKAGSWGPGKNIGHMSMSKDPTEDHNPNMNRLILHLRYHVEHRLLQPAKHDDRTPRSAHP
jgi:hypothetical protein